MTREEAIMILSPETRLEYLAEIEYKAGFRGVGAVASAINEALGMAISALREQEERSKGCEHCLSEINKSLMLAHGFAFCTDCGRRLEEV